MNHDANYIKITEKGGFNRLEMPNKKIVKDNQKLFLRRDDNMISLGTYSEAAERAVGTNQVIGEDGTTILGAFDDENTRDNLYTLPRPPTPPTDKKNKRGRSRSRGYRSRRLRSRGYRSRKSRRI
jgi:hypothetical protein